MKNKGLKPCRVVIKKCDPIEEINTDRCSLKFEIEKRTTQSQFYENIILDALDYAFYNFEFETYFLKLKAHEQKRIQVRFKNFSHVGHYFERYLLEVYEEDKDQPIGSQANFLGSTFQTLSDTMVPDDEF